MLTPDAQEWLDVERRSQAVPRERVPYFDSKLYGGQQFERLLVEFKLVVENIKLDPLTQSDVATVLGARKLRNLSDYAWIASDLTQKALRKHLLPLVPQLFHRAAYILERLVVIGSSTF